MSIVFDCPSCKVRLKIQSIGKQSLQCPKCGSPISLEVQAAIPPETPMDTNPAASKPAAKALVSTPAAPDTNSAGIDLSILSKPVLAKFKSQTPGPDSSPFTNGAANHAASAGGQRPSVNPGPTSSTGTWANGNASSKFPDSQDPVVFLEQGDASPVAESARQVLTAIPLNETVLQAALTATVLPHAALLTAQTPAATLDAPAQSNPNEIALSDTPTSVHVAILKRKKRQSLFFFVTNSVLALLILAMGGALYWKISAPAATGKKTSSHKTSLVEGSDNADNETLSPQLTNSTLLPTAPSESPGPLPSSVDAIGEIFSAPVKRPDFNFFSKKQITEIWKLTKPHLVQLNIEGPYGKQRAVGLIVDSRGWLLTSYQAVKDATRIEVTAAIEKLDQTNIDAPLVDLVRGRVIDDPQNDLAILAINRRFVVSLAEAPIAAQDRLVVAQRMLAAAPPSRTNYWGVCEVNIAQRSAVGQLPLSAKSRIELNGIGNEDLSWLTLEGASEWLPGTPLIDQSGTVQAMVSFSLNSSAEASPKSVNNRAVAVPLATLRTLIQKASGNITPLASNQVQTKDGKLALLPNHHASKKRMAEINLTAMRCREFGWLPENMEQYQQLADFAEHLIAGQDFLLSDKPDYRTPDVEVAAYEQVEKLIEELTEEISTRVRKVLDEDPEMLEPFNRLAEQKLTRGESGLIPMFAKVSDSGLQLNQFIVQIDGFDTYCVIPFDPVAQPLRPGTHWWLVVENKKSIAPRKYLIGEAHAILAYSAFQRFEIGPLEPK